MIKLCFIDVETSGLDPIRNGIVQLAGQIVHVKDGKPETKVEFDYNIAPFSTDVVEETALAISGRTEQEVKHYPAPKIVYSRFKSILEGNCDKYNKQDKLFFVGYNAGFDYSFMRQWFEKNGDKFFGSWFWSPPIDVMALAAIKLMKDRPSMPNFKLETVVNHLGIVVEGDFHDAMKDIEVTRQLYFKLTEVTNGNL